MTGPLSESEQQQAWWDSMTAEQQVSYRAALAGYSAALKAHYAAGGRQVDAPTFQDVNR